jgi:dTDP-4-amino-4,6-dideoxygalactose transaminase
MHALADIKDSLEWGIYIARHQFWNLRRALKGKPLTTPSFIAPTTEEEDARHARNWLNRPVDWHDAKPVERFEAAFADWNGSAHASAFMGGRVALSAIIDALGLGHGDEVIVPGYTCIVVPNAFDYAGIDITYADIELDTYGPDAESVESKITDSTTAILVHHLYGLVCRDYEALLDLADRHDLQVIEDCTHATGARYDGERLGNRGDAAFYSSEHSKCFSTVQGGIATTNDPRIARGIDAYANRAEFPERSRIQRLLHTFLLDHYTHSHPRRWFWGDVYRFRFEDDRLISTTEEEKNGSQPAHYGQRMPAPLAHLGLGQLSKLDLYNERRRRNAEVWHDWCDARGYRRPHVVESSEPTWLRYPVLVESERKDDLSWAKDELGLHPGVWFQSHLHPVDRPLDGLPNADEAVARCINLPTLFK